MLEKQDGIKLLKLESMKCFSCLLQFFWNLLIFKKNLKEMSMKRRSVKYPIPFMREEIAEKSIPHETSSRMIILNLTRVPCSTCGVLWFRLWGETPQRRPIFGAPRGLQPGNPSPLTLSSPSHLYLSCPCGLGGLCGRGPWALGPALPSRGPSPAVWCKLQYVHPNNKLLFLDAVEMLIVFLLCV